MQIIEYFGFLVRKRIQLRLKNIIEISRVCNHFNKIGNLAFYVLQFRFKPFYNLVVIVLFLIKSNKAVEKIYNIFFAVYHFCKFGHNKIFKGVLADANEATARLHTATHLLQAALRKVLGDDVAQRGSNITPERLRFDFSFERKVAPDELKEVERLVNEAIAADAPITCVEMTVDEARAEGAIGLFGDRYGERVKVYTMGEFSKEICGGPHAAHTGELGTFKIKKEEASSAGVRRIKAVLE